MSYTKFNWVYRQGAVAGSPVPSYYTCTNLAEISGPTSGDMAYLDGVEEFYVYDTMHGWVQFGSGSTDDRVTILEFYVAFLLQLLGVH